MECNSMVPENYVIWCDCPEVGWVYLGQRLSKGAKVTNWESPTLSEAQAKYAANDAFVSLLIFEKMFT